MNWIKFLSLCRATTKDGMRSSGAMADWYMQYGQQKGIQNQWKDIINQTDRAAAKTQIDALLRTMEDNSEVNGFFTATDDILVDSLNGFKLDDRDLYDLFFENLKTVSHQPSKTRKAPTDGWVIFQAVKKTVDDYLGAPTPNARARRATLTMADDDLVLPSIKKQRGLGTGLCTECAAITHNLWLLTGKTSYYINTKTCTLDGDQQFANDGHTFCIVEYDGKYRMCDFALNNFGPIKGNPIEAIKNGQALHFGASTQNTYIAADQAREQTVTTDR